ncbi:MAG: hypothetical protein P8X66_15095 [Maritimibacter sp.]|jgi:hypothetical protein
MTDEMHSHIAREHIAREDQSVQDWLLPISMGGFSLLAYAWLAFGVQNVEAGSPVAIVFPPTWHSIDAFQASATLDVDIMSTGQFDFVTIVNPHHDHALDDLRAAGGLFLMKTTVKQLCTGGDTGIS